MRMKIVHRLSLILDYKACALLEDGNHKSGFYGIRERFEYVEVFIESY